MSAAAANAPDAGAAATKRNFDIRNGKDDVKLREAIARLISPRVLLIAARDSYRTAPYLQAALEHGIELMIAAEGRYSLVGALSQGLHIDFNDPNDALELIEKEARKHPFSGVIATDDSTTEFASLVARSLGLAHNEPSAIRIARRKDLARQALAAAALPVPEFRRIRLDHPLERQIQGFPFPCVIKPLAMSGSRGVIRCNNLKEFLSAARRVESIISESSDEEERSHLLLESFIPGSEIALEGLLQKGRLEVLAIFDKPEPLNGPYFEETYYVCPTRLDSIARHRLTRKVERACEAYGLAEGPIHAECRINPDGIWILELAARTIGGLCSRLFRYGVGHSLEELVLHQAMGISLERPKMTEACGVLMIPTPKPGVLRRVEGVAAASRVQYIQEVVVQIREGYELIPLPEGSSYLGFIFAVAPEPEQVEHALRKAHDHLNIVVAPLWKGIAVSG